MSQIESFATTPLQKVIPSYLYLEYSDDDDLQAFVASQNALAQGYLDWFNTTPLAVYTSPSIMGALLDWIGQGIYGIPRPVISSQTSTKLAGYNELAYNTIPYDGLFLQSSGTAEVASDDIYKRVMTWQLYRGDGQVFTVGWLKNRTSRFLHGMGGLDFDVLNAQPSITVSGNTFTVTDFSSPIFSVFQALFSDGAFSFPFQYTMVFNNITFVDNAGVLTLIRSLYYPTSATGLSPGSVWDNAGVISVIPGVTPNPMAPPVLFDTVNPITLLSTGGGDLPLTNPGAGTGIIWNNGGTIQIA